MKTSLALGRNVLLALTVCCLVACFGTTKVVNSTTKWSKKKELRPLEIHGAFSGDHLHLHSLTVFGSLNLKDSKIDHDMTVHGYATLENVEIAGTIRTKGLSLKNCTTKNIAITSNSETMVKIAGATTIDGELLFSRTKGLVRLSKNTNLSGGVINGHVEEEKEVERTGPIVDGKERSISP